MFHHDIAEEEPAAHISQQINQRAQSITSKKYSLRFGKQQAGTAKEDGLKTDNHRFCKPQYPEKKQYQRKSRRHHESREPADILNKVPCEEKIICDTQIQPAVSCQVSDFPHTEIFI